MAEAKPVGTVVVDVQCPGLWDVTPAAVAARSGVFLRQPRGPWQGPRGQTLSV